MNQDQGASMVGFGEHLLLSSWCAAVHGVTKSWTRLSDFTFHLHALEKEMATHSSVLAWRITGTGGLVSMGLAA